MDYTMPKCLSSNNSDIFGLNMGSESSGTKRQISKSRPGLGTCGILTIVLLIMLLIGLSITTVLLVISRNDSSTSICEKEECLYIASSLKQSMNTSVDPCDDFYEFTCGRWPTYHTPMCPGILGDQDYGWFKLKKEFISRKVKDLLMTKVSKRDIEAVKNAKQLYHSCILIEPWNKAGLKPIHAFLKELDLSEIPKLFDTNGDFKSNFVLQAAKVNKILGSDLYFGSGIAQDPRDGKNQILSLDKPTLESPFPAAQKLLDKKIKELNSEESETKDSLPKNLKDFQAIQIKAYKTFMCQVIYYIINNKTWVEPDCTFSESPSSDNEFLKSVEKLYKFNKSFKDVVDESESSTSVIQNLADGLYMEVNELQNETDAYVRSVNESLTTRQIWRPFLQELFADVENFDVESEEILVKNLDFLKNVSLLFATTDEALLESFIWWNIVEYYVPFGPTELRKYHENYLAKLNLNGALAERTLLCAENVMDQMGMAVTRMYADPSFIKDGERDKVFEMLGNIRKVFQKNVKNVDWMDEKTKNATLDKEKKMSTVVGYPSWLFNNTELNAYYQKVNITSQVYFENLLNILRLSVTNVLEHFVNDEETSDNEEEWFIDPLNVNALYSPQSNQIAIPIAMLDFPFYKLGIESLNYGAIGLVLGHELTHGFDDSGRLLDSDGNLKDWWTNETNANYDKISQCFVDQYNAIFEPRLNKTIDGEKTIDENIADNSGLRQAYDAYQVWKIKHGTEPRLPGFEKYTHEQLFFLGFAHMWCGYYTDIGLKWAARDEHPPRHVRIHGVLQNSEEFSKAWNCPVGSKMNPDVKCKLW